MRRRKKKGADIKLLAYSNYVIHLDSSYEKKPWKNIFGNDNNLHIEVGTGRGQFITTLAKNNPDINFIGMEIKEEILLKAVEKASDANLTNIKFVWGDVANFNLLFDSNELDRIYVNFCDPWPKKRTSKRRLTHRNFLSLYKDKLKLNGEIHFKTDNRNLFEFSLNEMSDFNLKLKNISLHLQESYFEENVTTEYEDKFMDIGLPIYRLEASFK